MKTIIALLLLLTLTACGKSEDGPIVNEELKQTWVYQSGDFKIRALHATADEIDFSSLQYDTLATNSFYELQFQVAGFWGDVHAVKVDSTFFEIGYAELDNFQIYDCNQNVSLPCTSAPNGPVSGSTVTQQWITLNVIGSVLEICFNMSCGYYAPK